ncbi:MAG: AAA family ATPase [Treponema sp.]|nr:AAA family ATPase [Treponema sp.]
MAVKVLIVGESGAGKSTSLRNFNEDEIAIFNVSEKPLPFKKKLPVCKTDNMKFIAEELKRNARNCYCIDDAGLAMTFYLFGKVNETGYGKFTQVAKDFYDMVKAVDSCSDDTVVYFTMHTDRSEDGAKIKAKTAGRMIDNQLTLESLFTIVLYCVTDGKTHKFITQSDGVTTAKSPMEMFPLEMDNDLKAVDTAIREYYGLAKLGTPVKQKEKPSAKVETASKLPG